jgi:hypothetical protein
MTKYYASTGIVVVTGENHALEHLSENSAIEYSDPKP